MLGESVARPRFKGTRASLLVLHAALFDFVFTWNARYSEAVDSRTGRMKAHQVAGGTGGAKPPEKGKGLGSKLQDPKMTVTLQTQVFSLECNFFMFFFEAKARRERARIRALRRRLRSWTSRCRSA